MPTAPPEPSTVLVPVPLFHGTGCHSALCAQVWGGGTVVLMRKWDPEEATCSLEGDTFKAANTSFKYEGSMPAHGSVFASDQLWNNPPPVKAASYDEAKAKAKG